MDAEQPALQPASVYSAETTDGRDLLGRAGRAAFLAEVVAHRSAGTPLCIGIFGPAGSGKSRFLSQLLSGVEALGRAATEAGIATPFHGDIAVARVTAQPGVAAPHALLTAVAGVLANAYPRLLARVAHAGLDARAVAREAAEQLNAARTRLDAERQALDGLAGRRARLAETVLFEAEGSGIDAYVRGNRGRIERRMRAFGITGEPVTAFKENVRDAHDATTPLARGTGWLRAFYAYRGQGRLLALAAALLVAAWGLGVLDGREGQVIAATRSSSSGVADWLQAQWHWLTPARQLAAFGALAAFALNIARAVGFILPVQRGVGLLRNDLDSRRRELDSRLAHQTRRVDTLGRDVNRLSGQVAEAENRMPPGGTDMLPLALARSDHGSDAGLASAQAVFSALGGAILKPDGDRFTAPARLVVGLDGLDRLSSPEAAAYVQTAAALLTRPGLVFVLAADRTHLANGLAETDPALAAERLRRLVNVPVDLGADEAWAGATAFARALLDETEAGEATDRVSADAAISALDRPWAASEGRVLEAVAPLAGTTPRAVKQLVNLYRIARADPGMRDASAKELAALALGLALQAAGLPTHLASLPAQGGGADEVFDARRAIGAALGQAFSPLDGQRGYEVARAYGTGH